VTDHATVDVHLGDVIAGKYRVERVLGRGAMGIVVAAMHLELGELRAIKFMSQAALAEPEAMERFLREARAAARLKSLHVTKVHDVGRLASDAPYIVMEYLEGADLRALLKKNGPFSIDDALLYVLQACEALGEAHEAGIVHRDIKPGNLFLTTGVGGAPCIKVFDFGIAKLVRAAGADGGGDLTNTAAVIGTPRFMSPEQMRAQRTIDARSDIWALGITLYNLLTRQTPFGGGTMAETCSSVLFEVPDPPSALRPEIPAGLDAVIMRCIEKEAMNRWPSCAALAAALLPFAGEAVQRAAPRVTSTSLPRVEPGDRPSVPSVPPARPSQPTAGMASDGALAASTGAPWVGATTAQPRAPRSAAWVAGGVGLLAVGMVTGGLLFSRIGAAPAPARSVAPELTAAPAAAPTVAPQPGSAAPTASPSAAPAATAPAASVVVAPAVDGGVAARSGVPSATAKPGGKVNRDPFGNGRK
jgi:serine/threonine-protein kinase